jgi:hypothetical protein
MALKILLERVYLLVHTIMLGNQGTANILLSWIMRNLMNMSLDNGPFERGIPIIFKDYNKCNPLPFTLSHSDVSFSKVVNFNDDSWVTVKGKKGEHPPIYNFPMEDPMNIISRHTLFRNTFDMMWYIHSFFSSRFDFQKHFWEPFIDLVMYLERTLTPLSKELLRKN